MPNSRAKGKRIELEARDAQRALLGLPIERGARNGVKGGADTVGWPGVRVEVKGYKQIAALKFLKQCVDDASGTEVPVVLMRQNGDKEFTLMLRFKDLPRLVARYMEAVADEDE